MSSIIAKHVQHILDQLEADSNTLSLDDAKALKLLGALNLRLMNDGTSVHEIGKLDKGSVIFVSIDEYVYPLIVYTFTRGRKKAKGIYIPPPSEAVGSCYKIPFTAILHTVTPEPAETLTAFCERVNETAKELGYEGFYSDSRALDVLANINRDEEVVFNWRGFHND